MTIKGLQISTLMGGLERTHHFIALVVAEPHKQFYCFFFSRFILFFYFFYKQQTSLAFIALYSLLNILRLLSRLQRQPFPILASLYLCQ